MKKHYLLLFTLLTCGMTAFAQQKPATPVFKVSSRP